MQAKEVKIGYPTMHKRKMKMQEDIYLKLGRFLDLKDSIQQA